MGDFDKILSELGKSITLRKVSITFNDYGDTEETYTDVSTTAEIQIMKGDEAIVKAGILDVGDAIAFLKPDEDVSIGDRIIWNDETWEVIGIVDENLGTTSLFKEVHLKKKVK